MKKSFIKLGLIVVVVAPFAVFGAVGENPEYLTSKGYVDSRLIDKADSVQLNTIISNLTDNDTINKANSAIQSSDLAQVATSGDYNHLINTPNKSSLYEIRTSSNSSAATDDVVQVIMDDLHFKAIKGSAANRWSLRLFNNSGQTIHIGSRALHLYTGVQATGRSADLGHGSELNPDTESGDIGYSVEDTVVVHIFDSTNMHLYRWTTSVTAAKAIVAVEKLH